jgi:predicted NBD/HSP70 family sugar kinase
VTGLDATPNGTSGQRSASVRRSNLTTILTSLHLDGAASRSDLVARTGLTRGAIGVLVGELVDRGLVVEDPAVPDGNPGRPSPTARPHHADNVVLAMNVLVDSIAVAAVGLGGTMLAVERVERPRARRPLDETVGQLVALTDAVTASLRGSCTVHAVGVAVAGIVRGSDNMLITAPNLGQEPVGALIRDALGRDVPVEVANEGDLGALGESRRGIGREVTDLVYVSGEVGVGGGIISDGRRLTGPHGFAGEVGHVPVNPDGIPCNCGAVGCWETEVGEDALLRRAGRDPALGPAAIESMIVAAQRGDSDACSALDLHGRWIGIGLAGLVNVFTPSLVVLGGLFQRVHPFVAEAVDRELRARTLAPAHEGVTVAPSALGVDASLIGAAELAWEPVLGDPGALPFRRGALR